MSKTLSIAIVRGSSVYLDPTRYNIQEIGLAKALYVHGIRCDVYMAGQVRHPSCETLVAATSDGRSPGAAFLWRLPCWSLPGRQGVFPNLLQLLSRTGYDLVQVHEDTQLTTLVVGLRARMHGIPVVLCQGMYEDYRGIDRLLQSLWDTLPMRLIRWSMSGTIVKSEAAGAYLRNKGFRNASVLPVGIDPSQLTGGIGVDWRSKLPISPQGLLAVYVGSLDHRRRVDVVVEAVANVRRLGREMHLLVVGEGPGLETCRRLAAADPHRSTTFLGKLNQDQLGDIYAQADLCVLPTNYEIYGICAVEAMWFSTPVIASATGGLLDLIEDGKNGYHVKRLDTREWENALLRFLDLDCEARLQLRANARRTAAALTWDAVALRWASAYRGLVQRSAGNCDTSV